MSAYSNMSAILTYHSHNHVNDSENNFKLPMTELTTCCRNCQSIASEMITCVSLPIDTLLAIGATTTSLRWALILKVKLLEVSIMNGEGSTVSFTNIEKN